MLLAVDVGNTQTVFGLFDGEDLREHWRVATEARRTGDELGVVLSGFLDLEAVGGVCLSSTVPALVRSYEDLTERWAHAELLVVGPGTRTGMPIRSASASAVSFGSSPSPRSSSTVTSLEV